MYIVPKLKLDYFSNHLVGFHMAITDSLHLPSTVNREEVTHEDFAQDHHGRILTRDRCGIGMQRLWWSDDQLSVLYVL